MEGPSPLVRSQIVRSQIARSRIVLSLIALGAVACSDVSIRPEAHLPKPLITPMPAAVGLIIPPETRKYVDQETRFGIDWKVNLGPGEVKLMRDTFTDLFQRVEEFKDLESGKNAKDLKALFETRVDQYSFVTSRETGGRYYAVTIKYRINLYTPKGEKVDSYTLTGYGNSLAMGMSGGKPLTQATVAAMRDAAAKFLVQFPDQAPAQKHEHNEPVMAEEPTVSGEAGLSEGVPIDEVADEPRDTQE